MSPLANPRSRRRASRRPALAFGLLLVAVVGVSPGELFRPGGMGGAGQVAYRLERQPPAADREAVERAVMDYVEALYRVEPARIERSVHPELAKRGFARGNAAGAYRESRMSYEQLRALAGRWNQGGRVDPRTAVREIIVYDVLDQTATAKLVADWGVDYLHLARYDGAWKIVNVLWQSPPATE